MAISFRTMTILDYDDSYRLWAGTCGVGLSSADEPEAIGRYLLHNPDLSFVAHDDRELVGTILGGHDGRRGFIHHLAVRESHRRLGIGRQLVTLCLEALQADYIEKCHLFVFQVNEEAITFWEKIGFTRRSELAMMSQITESSEDQEEKT